MAAGLLAHGIVQPTHATPLRPARRCACAASRKGGRGGARGGGGGARAGRADGHQLHDVIREQRTQQLAATDLLARLLEAPDPGAVAREHVASLDEQFFFQANAFLSMAKKEGNGEVAARLEAAMRAAFEAKQATLRPEIQLLNRLLAAEDEEQRWQVLHAPDAAAALAMNDRYFFGLLGRMVGDVERQPAGEQRDGLLAKLRAVQAEVAARAEAAA